MNKTKKLFIALLAVMTLALGAFAVGCKKDKKFTLSFETNGGTEIASVQLDKGAEYDLPAAERTGYEFDGWYLNADFTGEKTTKVTVNENVTVYAKWGKLYKLTFDLNGGSMDKTSVYVKAGELVTSAVNGLAPTKADHQFGVWQADGKDLTSSYVMPEKDITLTVKYKTKYTVTLWKEDMNGTYVEEAQKVVDYAYAGTFVTKDFGGAGFELDANAEGSKPLAKISETVSENAFVLYYKRSDITVRFDSNYPDDAKKEDEVTEKTVKYGQEIDVPYNYTAKGYYLAGWAKSSLATEVEYEADYISSVLYNGSDDKGHNSKITPSENTTLYGVWVKGNSDMFGGDDYLFISATEENTVYLSRGGIFFKGYYTASDSTFGFADSTGSEFLEGKILADGTFAYGDKLRSRTYVNYINGVGQNTQITLTMDDYNGVTYNDKTKDSESTGTYVFDAQGYCVATFTDGELAGKEMYIRLSSVTISGKLNTVFIIRNDSELAYGTLYRGVYSGGNMTSYPDGYYTIKLDGFGTATFYQNPLTAGNYAYVFDQEKMILTLYTSGSSASSFRVYKDTIKGDQGQYDYVFYNPKYDATFESSDKTAKLTLDGSFNAVYEKGNEKIEGLYLSSDSLFSGGKIISLIQNGKTVKSLLITSKTETLFENGEETTKTTYSLEEKAQGYAEYYFRGADNTYYAPLIAINDTVQGHMTVYGYTTSGTYEKISEGTFTEKDGIYHYTATAFNIGSISKTEQAETGMYLYYHIADGEEVVWMRAVEDIAKIEEIEFGIGKSVIGGDVYEATYWYSAKKTGEGQVTSYVTEFTAENGSATLTRIGGMISFSEKGKTILGTYETSADGITAITAYDESNGSTESVYVKLNEETGKFVKLEYAPYTMYAIVKGNTDRKETLKLNGDGTAEYTVEGIKYEGTVTGTGKKTESGADIMKFESAEKTFEYLHLYGSSEEFFAKEDKTFKTVYEADGVGTITLDGFLFNGKFVAMDGTEYSGRTLNPETNVLVISADSRTLYFDIKGDDTFTLRGEEYGRYAYNDNNIFQGVYFMFNGYGKLEVQKIENTDSEETSFVKKGEGVYEYDEAKDAYTLKYTADGKAYEVTGIIGVVVSGGKAYRVFSTLHSENVKLYINDKDWSIIELDAAGNAVKYGPKGVKESGTYTIITENLLYFVNSSSTDACLYAFDKEAGVAVQLSRNNVSYYTENFESFNFTQYGFAIYNGNKRYYYDITDEGEYIIYRQPEEGETAQNVNEYGFITENLGKLEVYNESEGAYYYESFIYGRDNKQYFYNDGNSLNFDREKKNGEVDTTYGIKQGSGDKEYFLYLKSLTFQPSGSDEFEVSCTATFGGYPTVGEDGTTTYGDLVLSNNCTITRKKLDNGEYETYCSVTYSVIGYFRLDLDMNFHGAYNADGTASQNAGEYKVLSLKRVITAPAYQYLDNYYRNYLNTGSVDGFENDIGNIEFIYVYDENGEEIENKRYFRGEFGKDSGIVDINGNTFTVENGTFEEQSNGLFIVTFTVPDYEKKDGEVNDGYTYKLYTWITSHPAFRNGYGYRVYAYTRVQSGLVSGEYSVTVERMVYTELASGYSAGSVFNISIAKGGEEIATEARLTGSEAAYLITRTRGADDKITETKYYAVTFKEEEKEVGSKKVMPFVSASVSVMEMKTYYGQDGESYFDMNTENGEIMLVWYKGANDKNGAYYVPSTVEDQEDGSKKITTSDGSVFTVKISGETATIEKAA